MFLKYKYERVVFMKKILSLFIAFSIVLSFSVVSASACELSGNDMQVRPVNKNNFVSDYPYVFVHGMGGWGPQSDFYKLSPYWGGGLSLSNNDFVKMLNEQDVEAYAATIGPLNSAWDRACELYAQLTGTVVDYGEAHSKEHNHNRYGFSYEGVPLMSRVWSPDEKINLVGHSFGGETIRLFTSLMTYGCEDEIAITGEDTSPLFMGGNDCVHSCITLSSPHNGTQVANILYDPGYTVYGVSFLYNLIGSTLGNDFLVFSLQMSHFGLTPEQGKRRANINLKSVADYYYAEDNCYYDLTIRGAKELNEKIKLAPNTYYYSYSTSATYQPFENSPHIINKTVTPIFYISSGMMLLSEGKTYDGITIEGNWAAHDGIVPLASALYPECDADTAKSYAKSVANGELIEPGRWYYMETLNGTDHFDFCGTKDYPTSADDFYFTMVEIANSR